MARDIESGCGKNEATPALGCGCLGLAWLIFMIVMLASIKIVEPHQQVVYTTPQGKHTENGPFTKVIWPHQRHKIRDCPRLEARQYAVVKNEQTSEIRHETGPKLLCVGPYDTVQETRGMIVLQKTEYIRLKARDGTERVVRGPQIFVPEVMERGVKNESIIIGKDTAVVVLNKTRDGTSAKKLLITTEGIYVPPPYVQILEVRQAVLLMPDEYAVVEDTLTGRIRNELGPQLLKIGPHDMIKDRPNSVEGPTDRRIRNKIVLNAHDYLRLVDNVTASERILRGPQSVVPHTTEVNPEGKRSAIFLSQDQAVIVKNKTSGRKQLLTYEGMFTPGPYEVIEEIRQKIRVLPHEACVVRDEQGQVTIHSGASAGASGAAFFLPPYSDIVRMNWTNYGQNGSERSRAAVGQKYVVEKIDLRTRKMFFNYEVRTTDNVKLLLDGTIFWQVVDVVKLVSTSEDPEGDIYHRSRSALIQEVSRTTLEEFMAGLNNVTTRAFARQRNDAFFQDRGVVLQSMEVTGFDCVDQATREVLQEIIQGTTNKLNRLESQKSENDVQRARMQADITLELQRGDLIAVQAQNTALEAETIGQADGTKLMQRAASFMAGLETELPALDDRLELYRHQEKLSAKNNDTANLAKGEAALFLTPDGVNLKLAMPGTNIERRLEQKGATVTEL